MPVEPLSSVIRTLVIYHLHDFIFNKTVIGRLIREGFKPISPDRRGCYITGDILLFDKLSIEICHPAARGNLAMPKRGKTPVENPLDSLRLTTGLPTGFPPLSHYGATSACGDSRFSP
jgi:hypothetical protein